MLPRKLRRPIHAVYNFARTADDIADEGNASVQQRQNDLGCLKRTQLICDQTHTLPQNML